MLTESRGGRPHRHAIELTSRRWRGVMIEPCSLNTGQHDELRNLKFHRIIVVVGSEAAPS